MAEKVYVVETGCYDSKFISGVYASPEVAMAAHPPSERSGAVVTRPGGWHKTNDTTWYNGLDWDDAATIWEYEVLEVASDSASENEDV